MKQRLTDLLREREIRRLSKRMLEAWNIGDKAKARHFDQMRLEAIRRRSTGQVDRMERRAGFFVRRTLKQSLMHRYTYGRMPAVFVALFFKLFRLRGL